MEELKNKAPGITANRMLDVKGFICPMPLLRAKKEIDKISSGEILEIVGTDPDSRRDFPSWAARAGHEFLGEADEGNGILHFFIRKK